MEDLELVKKFGLEYLREEADTYVYSMEQLEPPENTDSFWDIMHNIYSGGVWTLEKGCDSTKIFNPYAPYFIMDGYFHYYSIESEELLYKYMEMQILSLDFEIRRFHEWCEKKLSKM